MFNDPSVEEDRCAEMKFDSRIPRLSEKMRGSRAETSTH